jgi:hypothetical protein
MKFRSRLTKSRNTEGSAIAETAPALFLLFLVILFPLIDLLYMGLAFGLVWYLNHLEVRELAVRIPAESTQVLTDIDTLYTSTGFGKFIGLTVPRIQHPGGATYGGNPLTVTCTTVATINPFLNIPFVIPVSGLNQPATFTVTSSRLQEEEGRN